MGPCSQAGDPVGIVWPAPCTQPRGITRRDYRFPHPGCSLRFLTQCPRAGWGDRACEHPRRAGHGAAGTGRTRCAPFPAKGSRAGAEAARTRTRGRSLAQAELSLVNQNTMKLQQPKDNEKKSICSFPWSIKILWNSNNLKKMRKRAFAGSKLSY